MSNKVKVDWRSLPAGRELDRIVAEATGWNSGNIIDCDGEWMDSECEEVMPTFSTDTNAMLESLVGIVHFRITELGSGDFAIELWDDQRILANKDHGSIAFVVCRALLAWFEGSTWFEEMKK